MDQIYLVWLLLCLLMVGDFKSEQLKYSRVKTAYSEKEKYVQDLLEVKGLEVDNLEIFIRAFKEEHVLEVWGKNKEDKHFKFIEEYPFCATSGTLGPKRIEGDSQIPEGFYFINRFNPQSKFYLSLGINYPNQSDRLLGAKEKLGGDIFIHGDCVTIGCIPLTSDKIKEVYLMAVEAYNNGQSQIPVHIFPAKLDPKSIENLKKRYASKTELLAFWDNLQDGFIYFEKNKKLPKISILSTGIYKILNEDQH